MIRKTIKKIPFSILFILFIGLLFGVIFYLSLESKTLSSSGFPPRNVPNFSMPAFDEKLEKSFFSQKDLLEKAPVLVNIWASWCAPCRLEHPVLEKLSHTYGIPIYGINFKDSSEKAKKFIERYGNPFQKIGLDEQGIYSLDWGIRGVPETFVINKQGKIVYKHQGELSEKKLDDFLSILEKHKFDLTIRKEK